MYILEALIFYSPLIAAYVFFLRKISEKTSAAFTLPGMIMTANIIADLSYMNAFVRAFLITAAGCMGAFLCFYTLWRRDRESLKGLFALQLAVCGILFGVTLLIHLAYGIDNIDMYICGGMFILTVICYAAASRNVRKTAGLLLTNPYLYMMVYIFDFALDLNVIYIWGKPFYTSWVNPFNTSL